MTKVRPPLTFENALSTIAGKIGWPEAARICGVAVQTARNWGDHDTTSSIRLDAALALDTAFHKAGGDCAPFLECYATRIEVDLANLAVDRLDLVASVAHAARESGEALAATLGAASPHAAPADIIVAERELEESIGAQRKTLCKLQALRKPEASPSTSEGPDP